MCGILATAGFLYFFAGAGGGIGPPIKPLPLLVATKHEKRTLSDGLRLEGEFLRRVGVDADGVSFGGGGTAEL